MLDLKKFDQKGDNDSYLEFYKKCLSARNWDPTEIDRVVSINKRRKELLTTFETKRSEQNKVGQEIAKLKKSKEDASFQLDQMKVLSEEIKRVEGELNQVELEVKNELLSLPNHLHESVPYGKDETENVEVARFGDPRKFEFQVKDHVDLGESLKILDFEIGAKVTGARFTAIKGAGARLNRALIQFMLDEQVNNGYSEVVPPFIVNQESLIGTSQLPKFEEDLFKLQNTEYYLVPTAEVPVTNFYRDDILSEEQLPIALTAYTPCFRSEAGSYGKDTRGMIRQHQFEKVELVQFVHPDKSYEVHEQLTEHAESILKKLELPYKKMLLCSGDISFGAARCYDLEVWLPSQNAYREISSCSNFEDFQSRRANIRFRPAEGGKPQFVHTLNGSGLAVGRTLVAILENFQNEDGSINIPAALYSYMGGIKKIELSK